MPDGASPLMIHITIFHDHVMLVIMMMTLLVLTILTTIVFYSLNNCVIVFVSSNESLETFWTFTPLLFLTMLAFPSLLTLYVLDEVLKPLITIKVTGNQWYWTYEYTDFRGLYYNSYMIPGGKLNLGGLRLLETDTSIIIPANVEVRLIITSSDVIHSWTIPSMGIKVDAVPGRLNQLCLYSYMVGVYYGQCSEICGALHSFMPICLEVVPEKEFIKWILMN